MDHAVRLFLMYFIIPLWLAVGIGDWLCHRATHIERNGGPKESLFHLAMLAEIGVPILIALFFEINATVIAIMLAALVIHEVTAWWDVSYASHHRYISTVEQHLHSFLEVLPLTALSLVLVAHWDQFLALFGLGEAIASHGFHWKTDPLPVTYRLVLIVAMLLFSVLPYMEELVRGLLWRHRHTQRQRHTGTPLASKMRNRILK